MNNYNIGDKVRLVAGEIPAIGQRDGWEIVGEQSSGATGAETVAIIGCHYEWPQVVVPWYAIEPEFPPIPPEPPRIVGQAWRDANGNTVVMGDNSGHPYIATRSSDDYSWLWWEELAHPLTPLYPVPDPDDDEAVEALCQRTKLEFWDWDGEKFVPGTPTVRAVLRALRGES